MKLKRLLKDIADIQIKGSKEIEITGLCAHSKLVAPGNLFIAKKGTRLDGTRFIPEAIAAGAVAVLSDICDPFLNEVVQIIYPNVAELEAFLAAEFYQFPSRELKVVGITGTNGKTTSTYLIKHLLDQSGMLTGLIGTVEWIIGKNHFPGTLTTPDVITTQKLLREMRAKECKAAVMEVSSHALEQKRVDHIDFEVALFTNLTQDHLDYHGNMENYAAAKRKLFHSLKKEQTAIFNADDLYIDFISAGCLAKKFTYGIDRQADVMASDLKMNEQGTRCLVHAQGKTCLLITSLIGKFNVYNLLGAISAGISLGLPFEQCVKNCHSFKKVSGRLERVKNALGLNIFVDYAHTDDALKNVLTALIEFKKGKLITVFGCGGNRDRGKRKKMGSVAEKYSDIVLITSDNPRNEDPVEIVREIFEGIQDRARVLVELDRRIAIQKAIEMATPEDIILIAGKGHETNQIFANQTLEFDDRKVAAEICASL